MVESPHTNVLSYERPENRELVDLTVGQAGDPIAYRLARQLENIVDRVELARCPPARHRP
jgi:hypothetical protein